MTRAVALTGAVLVALGCALAGVKHIRHGIPLAPTQTHGPWQVELAVSVRGDGQRGSVRALLPSTEPGQTVFDESASSDRLEFSSQERAGTRMGVFSGWLEGVHEVSYRFRVQSTELQTPLPVGAIGEPIPREIQALYSRPSADYPATAASVVEWIDAAELPPPSDVAGRLQTVFAYVAHEIATQPLAGNDALLTLDRREGSELGKERLLVTLLRAVGRPARLVHGLELRDGASPHPRAWVEAWGTSGWVSLCASEGFLGTRPQDWIVLGRSSSPLVQATGVRAAGHRFRAIREQLRPDEIAGLMSPDSPLLAWLSLYRLPLASQAVLRVLLLLPLGALVTALFRNFVGVRTYGTFMPALIALALRDASPSIALLIVGGVLGVGVGSRLALDRLRLLMVPRLSILLCIVVLSVAALSLVSLENAGSDWLSGATLPIVIFTMWIERITITAAEEGIPEAAIRGLWTLVIVACLLPVFRSPEAGYLVFTFPELIFVMMGLLIWIGGYTGYRIVEWIRFRGLIDPEQEAA